MNLTPTEQAICVSQLLRVLPKRDRSIVEEMYAINCAKSSAATIARKHSLSAARISTICADSIHWMRVSLTNKPVALVLVQRALDARASRNCQQRPKANVLRMPLPPPARATAEEVDAAWCPSPEVQAIAAETKALLDAWRATNLADQRLVDVMRRSSPAALNALGRAQSGRCTSPHKASA